MFIRKCIVNFMQLEYGFVCNSQISLRVVSLLVCTFAKIICFKHCLMYIF